MKRLLVALTSVAVVATAVLPSEARDAGRNADAAESVLRKRLGADTRISIHHGTGQTRFIGTRAGKPIPRPPGLASSAAPQSIARAFLDQNGDLFGVANQAKQLRLVGATKATNGGSSVRFQQLHQGVPVLGGELIVGLDRTGNILHANGETLPGAAVDVVPATRASRAAEAARAVVAEERHVGVRSLETTQPELWIYDPALLGGPGPKETKLVWRMDVTSSSRTDIREFALVDADTGSVVLHFDQIAEAKDRRVCNANNTQSKVPCAAPYARVEGQGPVGIADVDQAYSHAGGVYDFFKIYFKRDSIDNAGMPLVSTVKYCKNDAPCPFANAYWTGEQMVYGAGWAAADDVVGHEMVHGITERSARLLYWFQAGAISESMSDVFGEFFDLTNGVGNDGADVRWKIGEELPTGAVRDMADPTLFNDPDSMWSSLYEDGLDDAMQVVDSGGVHSNSGVSNKAAYLMTDGGTFNNITVTGMGIEKVARLYYEVLTNMLTSGSDYLDLYDALYQACSNMVGSNGFNNLHCQEVREATQAVRMHLQPIVNGFGSFPDVTDAPMCPPGQIPADLFYDNMENPASGNWSKKTLVGQNKWTYSQTYATSGDLALNAEDPPVKSDTALEMTDSIPFAGGFTYLRFSHAPNFDYAYDPATNSFVQYDCGGVEYSVNDGPWTDAGSLMSAPEDNGYSGTLSMTSDNPIEGRQAFTDLTGGYAATRADLGSLPAGSIKVRFRVGTDTGNSPTGSFWGWYIDDVRIYSCASGSRPWPTDTNLLRNPGFEWDDNDDGYADYWSMNTSNLRTPKAGRNRTYAMLHSGADDPEKYTTMQRIRAQPGSYFVKAYTRIPTTTKTVKFTIQVEWHATTGAVIEIDKIKAYTDDTGGSWNAASKTLTAPAGAIYADVQMAQRGLRAKVYVDNFQVKKL